MKKPSIVKIARQKLSFFVASLSLFTFVIGNMVGQHGWYAFWKTVLGKEDDSLIVFVGTVSPIAQIPDYKLWAKYGGSKLEHTFNQAPKSVLKDLPGYDQVALTDGSASDFAKQVYSTLWAGGYEGPHGSHPGVDIDAPRGTPIQSIANGVVQKVSMGETGFGHYVMIRHPNVPVSKGSTEKHTVYSTYAHMDAVLVSEGQVVHKGQALGTVGNTGLVFGATGYHLYFQVETDAAPFHPYWSFTSADISKAGMTFYQAVNSTKYQAAVYENTLNPIAFVQGYKSYTAPPTQVVQSSASSSLTAAERRNERIQSRMAKAGTTVVASSAAPVAVVTSSSSSSASSVSSSSSSSAPVVTEPEIPVEPDFSNSNEVTALRIETSGKVSRMWQKVKIYAVDKNGDTVTSPQFAGRLYLVPEFGEAEIRPSELTPLDFDNGVAVVNVLTRGNKTTFIATRGSFTAVSAPMVAER